VILLLVAFGSAVAAGLPLIPAVAGIASGFASLHLLGDRLPLSVWSMNFDDDRPRRRHRLQPVHRQPLSRGSAEGGCGRWHRQHTEHRRQGRVLSALTVVFSLAAVFVVPVMVFRSMALSA
jgi:RND superfamily putative drug exporter